MRTLNEYEWDRLSRMHRRCWDRDGNFYMDRYREFRELVRSFELRGYDVNEFKKYVELYDMLAEDGIL